MSLTESPTPTAENLALLQTATWRADSDDSIASPRSNAFARRILSHPLLRKRPLIIITLSTLFCCIFIACIIGTSVGIGYTIRCRQEPKQKIYEEQSHTVHSIPVTPDKRTRIRVTTSASIRVKLVDSTTNQIEVTFQKYALTSAKMGTKKCAVVTENPSLNSTYAYQYSVQCEESYSLFSGLQGFWGGALCSGTDIELKISSNLAQSGVLDLDLSSQMEGVIQVGDGVYDQVSAYVGMGRIEFEKFTARNLISASSESGFISISEIVADNEIVARNTFGDIDIRNTRTSWIPDASHPINESIWNTVRAGSKYGKTTLYKLAQSNMDLYSEFTGSFEALQSYAALQDRHITFTFETSPFSLEQVEIGCTKQMLCDMIRNSQPADKDKHAPWLRNGSIANSNVKATGYQFWKGYGVYSSFHITLDE